MMLGGTFVTVGSGLLFALHVNSGIGEWSGYQVVAAFGFGLGIQIPYVVVQNVPSAEDVATCHGKVKDIYISLKSYGGVQRVYIGRKGS